jgi:fused signal recognition particle receptor
MDQDVVGSIATVVTSLETWVRSHPEEVIEGLIAFLILALCSLLLALRSSGKHKEQTSKLSARVAQLEDQIQALKEDRSVAPVVAARVEEAAAAPPAAPPAEQEDVIEQATPLHEVVKEEIPIPELVPAIAQVAEETALSRGLKKSRTGFLARLTGLFSGRSAVDSSTLEDLEELLILSDVGARCASDLVAEARQAAEKSPQGLVQAELTDILKSGILKRLVATPDRHEIYQPVRTPLIVLVVGVNGVGKTTTVAKLATKYMSQGKKVLAVAADTFRAAAVEQLAEWSSRVGFTLVRGNEAAKPSAVVFDGMKAAKDGAFDVVLIDTAGRLHTKSNLMQELEGVRNSIRKHFPDGPHETVLVLDGVSGQNALSQAREFNQAVTLTGIVVTKLDGTPKGGIIVAISQELQLPVFYIGVGEKVDDLLPFNPAGFVDALFREDSHVPSRAQEVEPRVSNQ